VSDRRPHDAEELASLVARLAATLEELDEQLGSSRVSGVLRFTERYAIPTAIAALEANVRALEAAAGAIRVVQGRESLHDDSLDRDAARSTLDRALTEIDDAVQGRPTDPDARRLLAEARDLRDEIRTRVDEPVDAQSRERSGRDREQRASDADRGTTIPVTDESEEPTVDVDAELDTIREEVEREGDDE
jgi:hypothetical protein